MNSIKQSVNVVLSTPTGRKMIANLSHLKDVDKAKLSEYEWIDELPKPQQYLFEGIYKLMDLSKIKLALLIIKNGKV